MRVSIVIPTFNEVGNVAELVVRLASAMRDYDDAEIVFVDDSTDGTPEAARHAAASVMIPVTVEHRAAPVGGLAGAVVTGIGRSRGDWIVVMDADLQHPPESVPMLLEAAGDGVDVVVASRYRPGGSSDGLASRGRRLVSRCATLLARLVFPVRLRGCTDPMSGFFAIRRAGLSPAALRPNGFKILLEILARGRYRVVEVPFAFGSRASGRSKATLRQGWQFVRQLVALRTSFASSGQPDTEASTPAPAR